MINEVLADSAKLLFIVVAFVIIVDLILACAFLVLSSKFIANARVVKATITKLESNKEAMKATIIFKNSFGKDVETYVMVSPKKNYTQSDEIEILSNKNDPEKVRINSFASLWLIPAILLQGVVMLAILLAVLIYTGTAKFPF